MQEILNAIGDIWNNGIVPLFRFLLEGIEFILSFVLDIVSLIFPVFDFIDIICGGMSAAMATLCLFVLGFCLATVVIRLVR